MVAVLCGQEFLGVYKGVFGFLLAKHEVALRKCKSQRKIAISLGLTNGLRLQPGPRTDHRDAKLPPPI